MDPLSATGSVVAIIQLATKIVSVCTDYVRDVQDAPKDLRNIIIEVGSVNCILEVIELLNSQATSFGDSAILRQLKALDGPLKECEQTLFHLDSLFPAVVEHSTGGKRRRILHPLTRLAWPLKAPRARELLSKIGWLKATISLSLTTETA